MAFQGIIFDFNGVLLWDDALQRQAWGRMALDLRGRDFTGEEIALHVDGRPNRHTLEYLLGRALDDAESERLSEEKEQVYRRLCLAQGAGFRLSPGAEDLLVELTRRGIPRTIATSSGQGNVDFFFTHLGLARWFDPHRVVCDNGTHPGKPAPDIFLRAAHQLELPPGACVIVEDSRSGLKAAEAAGAGFIAGVGPAARGEGTLRLDLRIDSLAELPVAMLFSEEEDGH